MEWNAEVKLWGLLIVYLIIISFIIAIFTLFVKWNWTLFYACVPRLPIRSNWPPYLFAVLHLLNIIVLFAIYSPLIKIDFFNDVENPVTKVELVIEEVTPKVGKLQLWLDESPPFSGKVIEVVGFSASLEEQMGLAEIRKFNTLRLPFGNETMWNTLENSTCATGIGSTDLNGVNELLGKVERSVIRVQSTFHDLPRYLAELSHNKISKVDEKTQEKWSLIKTSAITLVPMLKKMANMTEERWTHKIGFEKKRTDNRIKMLYIPSISLTFVAIFSIFINICFTNSPVPCPYSGFLTFLFYAITFQVVILSTYQGYSRHARFVEEKCDLSMIAGGLPGEYKDVIDRITTCGQNNEKVFTQMFKNENEDEDAITEYQDKLVKIVERHFSNISIPESFVDQVKEGYKLAKEWKRKIEKLDPNCEKDVDGFGGFKTTVVEVVKYLNVSMKFLKHMDMDTLEDAVGHRYNQHVSPLRGTYMNDYNERLGNILSEIDFNCQPIENIIFEKDQLACTVFDKFYKDISECAAIVCSVVCVVLCMMAHRRTDLRQFAEDGRQLWVYKIDKGFRQLAQEFHDKVEMYTPPKVTFFHFDANECRNRYKHVLCMDKTRVVLMGWSQYIHASWVKIPKTTLDPMTHQALFGTERQYLVTQAPIEDTIWEFYGMCWQKEVEVIVMLCSLVENGVQKCTPYYPTKKGVSKIYENYKVTCYDVKEHPVRGVKWAVLKLESLNEIYTDAKYIDHVYATWWPEKGVPDDPRLLIDLYEWVNWRNGETDPPIVVHSSAGIGRAGTYVAFDYLNARTHEDHYVSVSDLVKELRKMRWGAIETEEQFIYLVVCLVEFISMEGVVDHELGPKYIEEYENYKRDKEEKSPTQKMESEKKEESQKTETEKTEKSKVD